MVSSGQRHISTYDWEQTAPSVAIVTTVARLEQSGPDTLPPLGNVIDPDALDRVAGGATAVVSFFFAGYRVRIDEDELCLCPSDVTPSHHHL